MADLSLRWTHMPFCWFCHALAHIMLTARQSLLQFQGNDALSRGGYYIKSVIKLLLKYFMKLAFICRILILCNVRQSNLQFKNKLILFQGSNCIKFVFVVLGFNDTSTFVGHFVSTPRERGRWEGGGQRWDSREDEREGQGRKIDMKASEETVEIQCNNIPPPPLQAAKTAGLA